MAKVYLAHSLSTTAEFNDSKRVADEIRALGYEVYAAAENASINDKQANDPTPADIYNADVSEILTSDILVVNLSAGLQDGTVSEVGVVAGFNEVYPGAYEDAQPIRVVAYTSNARLLNPQFHKGIPSASANHLVLGMIETWGEFVGGETDMLAKLAQIKRGG